MGLARKNNWVDASSDTISLKNPPDVLPGEKSLKQIGEKNYPMKNLTLKDLSGLLKRPDFVVENVVKQKNFIN